MFKTSDQLIPFPSAVATGPGIPLNLLVDVFLVGIMDTNFKDINVNFTGSKRKRIIWVFAPFCLWQSFRASLGSKQQIGTEFDRQTVHALSDNKIISRRNEIGPPNMIPDYSCCLLLFPVGVPFATSACVSASLCFTNHPCVWALSIPRQFTDVVRWAISNDVPTLAFAVSLIYWCCVQFIKNIAYTCWVWWIQNIALTCIETNTWANIHLWYTPEFCIEPHKLAMSPGKAKQQSCPNLSIPSLHTGLQK